MSYDQHQLDAKDTICTKCGKSFAVTNLPVDKIPAWKCFDCRK